MAGYLVHEFYETVPSVLLVFLEVIDSKHITTLVDYFRKYNPYLVPSLLPDDASSLNKGDYYVQKI